MLSETYETSDSIIHYTSAVLAVAGGLWGLWTAAWRLNFWIVTDHLGPVCRDKQEMGLFVAKVPSWGWWFLPFFLPFYPGRTAKPRVPTVSALIKAGDAGVFTSSMFDYMRHNPQTVSWRSLYEAYFYERAWAAERQRSSTYEKDKSCSGDRDELVYSYSYMAEEKVWKAIRQAQGKEAGRVALFIHWWNTIRGFNRFPLREISPNKDSIHEIDPHLLYYAWRFSGSRPHRLEGQGDVESAPNARSFEVVGPLLVRSYLELPDIADTSTSNTDAYSAHWTGDSQEVWIRDCRPCITVSDQELAALSFTLGLALEAKDFLPNGVGAFNTCLTSVMDNGLTKIKLVYGKRQLQRQGGIGYSTLFARHMACGCLPFATSRSHSRVHTISVIGDNLHSIIEQGEALCDTYNNAVLWGRAGDYLDRLPGSNNNYYHNRYADGKRNHIYMTSTAPRSFPGGGEVSYVSVGKWTDAVARIAFGGLVPMATKPLVDAVRFTVDGTVESDEDVRQLDQLISDVLKVADAAVGGAKVPLFSPRTREFSELIDARKQINFGSWLANDERSTREVVQIMSTYTILLESLIALTPDPEPSGDDDVFVVGERKAHEVFRCCCDQVWASYDAAVTREHHEHFRIAEALEEIIRAVESNRCLRFDQCAVVARCIILVWTKIVKIVDWDNEKANQPPEHVGHSLAVYKPVPLTELPDIAVWE